MRWIFNFAIVALLVTIVCGIHSFLDDTEVVESFFDKALNRRPTKKPTRLQPGSFCNSTVNGTLEGTCTSKRDCRTSGGQVDKSNRQCGVFNVCCISLQNGCDRTSKSKIAYFSNSLTNLQTCSHTVNLISQSVCQIRLDFESFAIGGPLLDAQSNGPYCSSDSFTVTNALNRIPTLCGNLTGQHLYIYVNGTQTQSVQLNITHQDGASVAMWNIRITQLECPLTITNNKHRKGHILENKKNPTTAAEDFPYLAPFDCLQYYIRPSGTVSSFNFIPGPTIANLDYSICFKKRPNDCGITYSNIQGSLSSPTVDPNNPTCPNYVKPVPLDAEYCTDVPPGGNVTAVSPGPLYLIYHTTSSVPGSGFSADYSVISSCTTT